MTDQPASAVAPSWTRDLSDDELASIAADTQWWSGYHRRQARKELKRRELEGRPDR